MTVSNKPSTSRDIIRHANARALDMAERQKNANPRDTWATRHVATWNTATDRNFVGAATAIAHSINAAAMYADAHFVRFDSRIGDDYVLGVGFAEWLKGVRTLLCGDIGRLDAGTVDGMILDIAAHNHIDPDTFDLGYTPTGDK